MEYQFDTINETVKITPMKYLFCDRVLRQFIKNQGVELKPNYCFSNAVLTAEWFQEHGFDVEVVEGRISGKDFALVSTKERLNDKPIEHRWCKKGDHYFDPTLEIFYGYDYVKGLTYDAKRLFDAETLREYAEEIEERFGELKFCDSISGLTYAWVDNEDVPIFWGNISEEYEYVVPEENPVEVRAKAFGSKK